MKDKYIEQRIETLEKTLKYTNKRLEKTIELSVKLANEVRECLKEMKSYQPKEQGTSVQKKIERCQLQT